MKRAHKPGLGFVIAPLLACLPGYVAMNALYRTSGNKATANAGYRPALYATSNMPDATGNLTSGIRFSTDATTIKTTQRTIIRVADEAAGISNQPATVQGQFVGQIRQFEWRAAAFKRSAETATAMEEMYATGFEVAQRAALAADVAVDAEIKAERGAGIVSLQARNLTSRVGEMQQP